LLEIFLEQKGLDKGKILPIEYKIDFIQCLKQTLTVLCDVPDLKEEIGMNVVQICN